MCCTTLHVWLTPSLRLPAPAISCLACPSCPQFDFNPFLEDDEQKAMQIQENMKFAVANIFPRPFDSQPTAGALAFACCWCCAALRVCSCVVVVFVAAEAAASIVFSAQPHRT